MKLTDSDLEEIVGELASKPRHEKVRALIYKVLTDGLGADSKAIDFEKALPEARGRTDALLGNTVFEFKTDLDRETGDAEEELSRYLQEREAATRSKYIGLATDGSEYIAYENNDGQLAELKRFRADPNKPRELMAWIDGAVALAPDLPPDPLTIVKELGRESVAYRRSLSVLRDLWIDAKSHPDASLKRQLWDQLLAIVYGKAIEDDELWLQHTYLICVAKSIAHRALGLPIPSAGDMLSGRLFLDAGIRGAIESDFFDWVISQKDGVELVERLAKQVERFDLDSVDTDVLKVLYESLIDPEQRHDLGEYYTPDWLADLVCEQAINDPLKQKVLDPACGSGSFLFHAIRRLVNSARKARVPGEDTAALCCTQVYGMDIHPVAVIIARVTYLLALGDTLQTRKSELTLPVYLGGALQWNVRHMMAKQEVVITVPGRDSDESPVALVFPATVCERPAIFDKVIDTLLRYSAQGANTDSVRSALRHEVSLHGDEESVLLSTYEQFRSLYEAGRNHIWGYVARNLSRPLWLSETSNRPDVVVGNPPWLSFRYMAKPMQKRAKEEMQGLDIWVGGKLATHQDLSSLFFAKAAEKYLSRGGKIAFVMPLAAVTRGQYEPFRSGRFSGSNVSFEDTWIFDDDVSPLFPVPSSVLFATRSTLASSLPDHSIRFRGHLPLRDASRTLAQRHLDRKKSDRPIEVSFEAKSPYRSSFKQGATLVPRMLCMVERAKSGKLGESSQSPRVVSYRSKQEKSLGKIYHHLLAP